MSTIIGIDLGTSTTEAAIFRNGKAEMIPNPDGVFITPSAVGIDPEGNWIAGARAMAQYPLFPENTAIEVKRKTGSGETIPIGKAQYRPVELQSRLLSYVRGYASEYIGESVDRVVISVPAYFNDLQRRETALAGELAGLTVERILNEPTAAALSYGLEHMDEESHVLVYDLGGGTFDVTLLEMFDGVLEVKASSGDNTLGGKDFDELLCDHLLSEFRVRHNKNLRRDRYAMVRVKEAAEQCKIALSDQEAYRVLLPAICTIDGSPVEMDVTVNRGQFEQLAKPLMERTHAPLDQVLTDTGLSEADIDRVILVGGSTRMPMVGRDIEDYLHITPDPAVNPDYAVSEGVAIMAGIITGDMDEESSLVMTDVNAFSLGVHVVDDFSNDRMSIIIPRNTTIPVTRKERYYTSDDYQTEALIEVSQGESEYFSHNHPLGDFEITGIPPRARGKEAIDVAFTYDLNGILSVTATLASTGREASIKIDLFRDKPKRMDVSSWKDAEGAKKYRTLVRTAERLASQSSVSDALRERLADSVYALKEALILGNSEKAADMETELKDLISEARNDMP